jgi:hypothetical protein
VFEAVCKGGKKTAVAQLMTITCFTRVKVLQLGGRLADQQLVHKTKRDGQTAHAKDRYLAAKDLVSSRLFLSQAGFRDSDQAKRLALWRRQKGSGSYASAPTKLSARAGAKARGGSLSCRSQQVSGNKSIAGLVLIDASFNAIRARLRTIGLNPLTAFWGGLVRQYRPEAHYVRGPGSKFRRQPREYF